MVWERLGRVFDPVNRADWMKTHAALPIVAEIDGTHVTALCTGRDAQGRGQIGAVTFSIGIQGGDLEVNVEPLLRVGPLGAFDDRGVLSACLVADGSRRFLYFTGVMLGQTVPFYYKVGLAIKEADSEWVRVSRAPILGLSDVDPFMNASPWILREADRWRMWYVSGDRWEIENGAPKHYYNIRYAESDNGVLWHREGIVCIDFLEGEYAISRPCVIRDPDCFRMWYAYRGSAYRIGYAESVDGIVWRRLDHEMTFDRPPGAWESNMQCYPVVFDVAEVRYMLYNGNDYGKTGFGLARMVT